MNLQTQLIIAVLCVISGFGLGCKVGSALKDRQIIALQQSVQEGREKALANIKRYEDERAARLDIAAQMDIERQQKAKVIEKVISHDVIKYVQTPASKLCGIDPDGVRIINASARVSEDPETTGKPDATPTAVTAAQVVESVTDNYTTCHANMNQQIALQEWVVNASR